MLTAATLLLACTLAGNPTLSDEGPDLSARLGPYGGTRDVSVTNPDGTDTLTQGFTVCLPATITSVDPSEGRLGETLTVTITCTKLDNTTELDLGSGITVNSFTVDSSTQITAEITITGIMDVSVGNPCGTADTLTGGFTVAAEPGPATAPLASRWGTVGMIIALAGCVVWALRRRRAGSATSP